MSGRPAAAVEAEQGTTLTEVLVVLTITTLLAVPLLAVVRSATRIEAGASAEAEARTELDWALTLMSDDLRTGAPVQTRPRGTRAGDTVGVQVTDDAGLPSVVYWSVGRRGLRRIEADPTTRRVRSRRTVNPDITTDVLGGDPAFRYFDAAGRELDPLTAGLEQLAECTALVEVALAVPVEGAEARGGRTTLTDSARHAVRTRSPGGNGC